MALIPPFYLDCVVAIGNRVDGVNRWVASGFLYGWYLGPAPQADQALFRVFLVSNRHVFEGEDKISVRVNRLADEPTEPIDVELLNPDRTPKWHAHPDHDVDVAVLPINTDYLRARGLSSQFFQGNQHVANRAAMKLAGVSEGDTAFILGFPMELAGEDRNYVVVRGGTIARIRDCLKGAAPSFMVDASVFPGNSGGPVVTRPEIVAIEGTPSLNKALLIGIVAAYVPYRDVAISQQTQRPRVIFEENSALAVVYPVDAIEEAIPASLRQLESAALPQPEAAPLEIPPEGASPPSA